MLKEKLRGKETVLGVWITLESPTISEIAAHIGLSWICIDTEHSDLDLQCVANHLRAINRSSTTGFVRIPRIDQAFIQSVLGFGAHGILVPRIRGAEELERAVSFSKYPPRGSRGMGVERSTLWGKGLAHAKKANQDTMVIPMIETVDAGRNIEAIMSVPDVDGFFFGPADFSASAGSPGEWEGSGIADKLLEIKERIRARHFPCGIMATDVSNGKLRIDQGFQMIGLGVDSSLLIRAIAEMMNDLGRPLQPKVWTGDD